MRLRARLDDAAPPTGCAASSYRAGRRSTMPALTDAADRRSRPTPTASSRRRTPTTVSTSCRPSAAELATAAASTCRSARRAIRRRPRSSRPWPPRAPSGATRRRSARAAYRDAAAGWLARRLGVEVDPAERLAACVGTKEFVAGAAAVAAPADARPRHRPVPGGQLPDLRDGRHPRRLPGGAGAGRRRSWRIDLAAIDPADAARALCLWVNTPGNPTGGLDDLGAAAAWGRAHGVPVFTDECYVEFTWDGPPRTILEHGSTAWWRCTRCRSARTSPASGPASTPATPTWCTTCREVRKHAGLMVPGPGAGRRRRPRATTTPTSTQQRERYRRRLERLRPICSAAAGIDVRPARRRLLPVGAGARRRRLGASPARLADEAGVLVSPGEFYGEAGTGHVRVAMVRPTSSSTSWPAASAWTDPSLH